MKTIIFVLPLLLLLAFNSVAQQAPSSPPNDSYVHKGSIGDAPPREGEPSPLTDLPVEKWLSQRFVFMPRTRQFQQFGYDGFLPVKNGNKKSRGYQSPVGSTIPYEKYVGRTATVSAVNTVKPFESYSDLTQLQLELTMDDTGEKLICEPGVYGRVDGVMPTAVLDYARSNYLNKTMWIVDSVLSTYDETQDESGYIHVRRYSPVRVREIVVSNRSRSGGPVRFVLESEDGKRGFVDVALSAMNSDPVSVVEYPLDRALLKEDPHLKYSWKADIWALIEREKVRLGMTEDQVFMSLGPPNRINRTRTASGDSEQWIYRSNPDYKYIYLTNGILTAIQD